MTTTTPPPQTTTGEEIATSIENVTSTIATLAEPTLWTAFLGFMTALPMIMGVFKAMIDLFKNNGIQQTIAKVGDAWTQIQNAKTDEDKQNAASNLASVLSKLK